MKIKACIMSIAHPQRLKWLHETIKFMDQQDFPFHKKIVIIDQFNGNTVPEFLVKKLENWGWEVKLVSMRSRIKATDLFFEDDGTDIIFYNEEDVKATLPNYNKLKEAFNTEYDNRKCGIISMTLGGTQYDAPSGNIGDLELIENNIILRDKERKAIFVQRLEKFQSKWFFEFPGLFIRENIFRKCHEEAKRTKRNLQIEMGLTEAYFNLHIDHEYYKASYCKEDTYSILKEHPERVNSHCRFLYNLDPNQGNSPFGGHHSY